MTPPVSLGHDFHKLAEVVQGLSGLFANPETRQTGINEFKKVLETVRSVAPLIPPRRRSLQLAESNSFRSAFAGAFSATNSCGPFCLLISDSIALPRPSIGVQTDSTYPFLVQQTLCEMGSPLRIEPHCLRGRTILGAAESIAMRTNKYTCCPKQLILQVGIVDCAPRVFLERDIEIVTKYIGKSAADTLIKLASKYRLLVAGDPSKTVYVEVDRFATCLLRILGSFPTDTRIHLVTIVTPIKRGLRSDDSALGSNIRTYNDVIRAAAASFNSTLVDADKAIWSSPNPAACFTNDNYHFNTHGHRVVASEILRNLETFTTSVD